MCAPVAAAIIASAVIGAGTTAIMGNQQRISAERQAGAARDQAQRQADKANELAHAGDQKEKKAKDAAEVLYGNAGDSGSTSLTGPGGAAVSQSGLGGSSVLGS